MQQFSNYLTRMIVFGLCLVLIPGCGGSNAKRPRLAKVKGKVVYKGEAVKGAGVTFMAEGASRAATGSTNDNGEFQLTTFDTNDGAILGTHKITVIQQQTPAKPMSLGDLAASGGPPESKESSLPAKYADFKTTPLTKTVEAAKNDFTLELTD